MIFPEFRIIEVCGALCHRLGNAVLAMTHRAHFVVKLGTVSSKRGRCTGGQQYQTRYNANEKSFHWTHLRDNPLTTEIKAQPSETKLGGLFAASVHFESCYKELSCEYRLFCQ